MSYAQGSTVPLSITVKDAVGALTEATVACTITLPDGTAVTPATSSDTTGVYYVDFVPATPGRHLVRWNVSDTLTAAYADVFEVNSLDDGPIMGLADIKAQLNITRTNTDDAEMYEMARAISDAIEAELGYPLRRRTVVENREGGAETIYLRQAPCACAACQPYRLLDVASVTEFGIPLALGTDYMFDAATGTLRRGPYGYGLRWVSLRAVDVVITYSTGYTQTPPWARQAFLRAMANSWQRTQQRPHPGIGQGPMADEANQAKVPFALPYHVMALLEPHRQGGF